MVTLAIGDVMVFFLARGVAHARGICLARWGLICGSKMGDAMVQALAGLDVPVVEEAGVTLWFSINRACVPISFFSNISIGCRSVVLWRFAFRTLLCQMLKQICCGNVRLIRD